MKKSNLCFIVLCALAVLGIHSIALGDWDPGDPFKMHWPQLPDLNQTGMDVLAGPLSVDDTGQIYYEKFLADDFQCTSSGPITGIHIWCSYNQDIDIMQNPFLSLVIYEDVPAGIGGIDYSRPGLPVWDAYLQPTVKRVYASDVVEGFYDPNPDEIIGQDWTVYQFNFIIDEANAFVQEEGKIYWLGIHHTFDISGGGAGGIGDGIVDLSDLAQLASTWPGAFGWKTSDLDQVEHFMDDAVWTDVSTWGLPPHVVPSGEIWNELKYPQGHPWQGISIDLAFVIDGPVEDEDLDFGDAPEFDAAGTATNYPTTIATGNDGARHVANGVDFLGQFEDIEPDGQPTLAADGDDINPLAGPDDEDGVTFVNGGVLMAGAGEPIVVQVAGPAGGGGFLNLWVDFNANWDWSDPGEYIFVDLPVSVGNNSLTINVPTGATPGPTYARFRYTTYQNAAQGFVGQASDGEVEDYEVFIEEEHEPEFFKKFQQVPLNGLTIDNHTYWGHDELSTAYSEIDVAAPGFYEGCYMADDFADLVDSPVLRLTWWGSYIEDPENELGNVQRFLIAFERDIPAQGEPGNADYVPSHPGEVITSQIVNLSSIVPLNPGEYTETYINAGGPPCYEPLFRYDAVLEYPFPQDPNTVYWVKIVALADLDPVAWNNLQAAVAASGLTLCEFLNLPFSAPVPEPSQQMYGLEQRLLRWGWHNRDYTKWDPFASTPPAVNPGEHNPAGSGVGSLPPDQIWHFQDDAVAGDVKIDLAVPEPEMPFVDQDPDTWHAEKYKYSLPYCSNIQGVDGPDEIVNYSKDLAFLLWTKKLCPGDVTNTNTGYIPPAPPLFIPGFDITLWDGPNGVVDSVDLQAIILLLNFNGGTGWSISPVPAEAIAADVTATNTGYIPPAPPLFIPGFDMNLWDGANGTLDSVDVQALILLLKNNGWSYPCP